MVENPESTKLINNAFKAGAIILLFLAVFCLAYTAVEVKTNIEEVQAYGNPCAYAVVMCKNTLAFVPSNFTIRVPNDK